MSKTGTIIDEWDELIQQIRNSATKTEWPVGLVAEAGENLWQSTRRFVDRPALSLEDAKVAAKKIGKLLALADRIGNEHLLTEVTSLTGTVLRNLVAPDRDECRTRAQEIFRVTGEAFEKMNDRQAAAIEFTNGALCILEMNNPTSEQLRAAHKACERTLTMRKKGSTDWAFSQFNLALANRKLVPLAKPIDRRLIFQNILTGFDRAIAVFQKHGEATPERVETYHSNVIETLSDWYQMEVTNADKQQSADRIPSGVIDHVALKLEPDQYIHCLRSNPAIVGYEVAPDWLPSEAEIATKAAGQIPELRKRITAAEKRAQNGIGDGHRLSIDLYRLKSALATLDGAPMPPLESLHQIWSVRDYERYFINATEILGWVNVFQNIDRPDLVSILERVMACLVYFREHWNRDRGSDFLLRNPNTFRFAACNLAAFGEWEYAFRMLDYSRGLDSSQTWDKAPGENDKINDQISWVFLTHSPAGSYAIMRRGVGYTGEEFRELPGKLLMPLFLNFLDGGMLSPGSFDRSIANRTAKTIERALRPLTEWVAQHSGNSVVLMPGGLLQAFPLWACGRLGEAHLQRTKTVTMAPSRAVSFQNMAVERDGTEFLIAEGSSVAGQDVLRWSSQEPDSIRRIIGGDLTPRIEASSRRGLLDGMSQDHIVHFTGHSTAAIDPLESALVTYSGELTVAELLDNRANVDLVVFASCESGKAMSLMRMDEMLSVQTAAYYMGAGAVIGTYWPISDPAGFAFTTVFYEHLFGTADRPRTATPRKVIRAHAFAANWMRNATVADLKGLADRFNIQVNFEASNHLAFDFIDWSAYGLVAVDNEQVV